MKTKSAILFTTLVLSLTAALGNAQTTNGMGGSTDVGTFYEQIYWPVGAYGGQYGPDDSWHYGGFNYLPLEQVSSGASYEYQMYIGNNVTVIDEDLARLAAAKFDFIVLDLSGSNSSDVANGCTSSDWAVVSACAVATEVALWNYQDGIPAGSAYGWKLRYAIAAGPNAPNGGHNNEQDGDTSNFAPAVYNGFVNTFGAANYYQINGLYLMFNLNGGGGTCTGTCTDTNLFWWTAQSGHGQWGWNLNNASYNSTATQIGPGWDNYLFGIGGWFPRNDGSKYANDWNVVFGGSPYPRIVWIESYNDWIEDGAFWNTDTATISYPPYPVDNTQDSIPSQGNGTNGGRYPESWTLPDENITLGGYWDYTTAAICYLRNGNSSTECSSSASPAPSWPQPAPNLAVTATADASSCVSGNCTSGSWVPSNAADGNPDSAWSSQYNSSANTTEWIRLTWPSAQTFNTVVLVGRNVPLGDSNGFPVTFEIDVWNSSTMMWDSPIVQETNFPQPTIPGQPISFTWGSPVTTTQVRVKATTLGKDPGGNYYFQLGELEVMNESSTAAAPFFANWGFEAPYQGSNTPYYQNNPTGAGWTFSASSGVQENGSGYNAPQAPQGMQTGYLTGSSSTISQTINLPAGTYSLRFLASETDGQSQTINVSYGSTNIGPSGGPFSSFPSTGFAPYVTNSFTSTGGSQTITFAGASSGTALIDEVQIFNMSSVDSNLLADPSWSSGNLSSWNVAGTTSAANLIRGGYNGDPYVLNEDSTSSSFDVVAYQDFTGQTPSNSFTASVYAETSSSTSLAYVGVQDGTGSMLCYTFIPAGVSSWTMYSCTYNVPSDGKVRFLLSSNSQSANDWTRFDNAALYVIPNLLVDPSWSSGSLTSPWGVAGTTTAASIIGGGYNGDAYELSETSTSGSFNVVVYQDVPSQPAGHTFTASVYAQSSTTASGNSGNGYIGVQDGSGSTPQLCPVVGTIPAGVSSWTQYSCTGTVPASGILRFVLSSGNNSTGAWTYFDSPSLVVF
jgi:hypothetical protein